jgi:hypothetical protein
VTGSDVAAVQAYADGSSGAPMASSSDSGVGACTAARTAVVRVVVVTPMVRGRYRVG